MKIKNQVRSRSLAYKKRIQTTFQTDIQSSCGILTPQRQKDLKNKKINKKRKIVKKTLKKQIFHQKIYRFTSKRTKKTQRIYCYKQSDLGWPKKYTNKLCLQEIDNDVDSDSQLIENQIEKCCNNLFNEIVNYKNNKSIQTTFK